MKLFQKYSFVLCAFLLCSKCFAQNTSVEQLYHEAKKAWDTSYFAADSLAQLAIARAQYEEQFDLLPELYYLSGKIQASEGWFEESEVYFLKAIELAEAQGKSLLVAKYKSRLSDNYLDKGNMDKAVKLALEAIDITRSMDNYKLLSRCLTGLAEIYRYHDYLDLAIKYNREALIVAKKANDEDDLARAYNNLSAVLGEIGQNEEAIDSLRKGLSILSDTNWYGKARLNSNMGYCFRNMGEFEKALMHHRVALRYKKKANDEPAIPYTLGSIGRAYVGLGNTDSAIYYTKLEREGALRYKNPFHIRDATMHLAEAYEAAKDYKNAFRFAMLSDQIKDSLFAEEVEQKALLYQRKYDLSQKEQELQKEKNLRELERERQHFYLTLLLSLLFIMLLLVFAFRMRALKRKKENQLAELKLETIKAEQKRDKEALKAFTNDLLLKNKSIRQLTEKLQEREVELKEIKDAKSDELEKLAELKILTEEDWTKFKGLFEKVYPQFFMRLNASELKYTKGEKRLMALIKLDMGNSEIADVLGISAESVSKSRFRLKKKLEKINVASIEELVFQK